MSSIKDIYDIIEYININNFKINILNIFIDIKGDNYLNKYKSIIKNFNEIECFDQIENFFSKEYLNYKKYINYIKLYYVLEKNNQNIILFNPNVYENLDDIEYNKNNTYVNENNNLIYSVKQQNNNTLKLINFLLNQKNFINSFSKKQNTKTFIYSKLWKNKLLKNNEEINLDLLNFKNNTNEKTYKEIKDFKIKKLQTIEFSIHKEKITSNVRLSLPNTIILGFTDLSFVQLNKIVISNTLNFNDLNFNSFKEKIDYFINIHKMLFDIDIHTINIKFNITIKKENKKKIKYNELVYKLNTNKILFSDDNINIKYINNIDELKNYIDILKIYEEKLLEIENKFLKYNFENYLLYLDNKTLEKFFDI